jgi:DNA polymerase-3 subunit gamma/tau
MHQVIARTWRPQLFSEVIGQRHITQTLQNALRQNRVAHGYVFSGQRGVGKTTMARLLAKALNCHQAPPDGLVEEPCGKCDSCREVAVSRSVDVIEIDAASNRGIDAMRELRENVRYGPARDRYKVFIIDEAHQITTEGFNALLKTLEEPPPHVVFILATTELHELPETILSRCQHFSFHAAKFAEILAHLEKICDSEKVSADPEALAALAAAAGGSLRDALSHLEQAMAAFGTKLEGAAVLRLLGAVPSQLVEEVFIAVGARNREQLLNIVARLVEEGYQLPHFCSQLVRAVRNLLVAKLAGPKPDLLEASPEDTQRIASLSEKFSEEDLMRFLEILLTLHQQLRQTMEPRFQTELGLLKLVEAERLVSIEEALAQFSGSKVGAPEARGSLPAARGPAFKGSSLPEHSSGPGIQRPSGLSPFERDTMRKRTSAGPQTSAGEIRTEELAFVSTGPANAPSSEASGSGTPPAETRSRGGNWAHEVMRNLEDRQRFGLASMLEGAQWEFGEGEVRIRLGGTGIAKAMPEQDRQTLEQLVGEIIGQKVRLSLVEEMKDGAAPGRGSGPRKAASKSVPAMDPEVEAQVRQDPEVREFEQLFGKPVSGIRRWKE